MEETGHDVQPRAADRDDGMGSPGHLEPSTTIDPLFGPLPGPTVPPPLTAPLPLLPEDGQPDPGGPGPREWDDQNIQGDWNPDSPDDTTASHTQDTPSDPLPGEDHNENHPDSQSKWDDQDTYDDWDTGRTDPGHTTASHTPDAPGGPLPGEEHGENHPDSQSKWDDQDTYDDWDPGRTGATRGAARRRLVRMVAILTAAVLAVTVTVVLATRGDETATQDAKPTAAPVPPDFIDSARTDTDPVAAGEFFGETQVTVSGNAYRRLASQLDDACPQLTGTLPALLAGDRCRQLVRALYVTEPAAGQRGVLVGMSVFVLDDKTTAQAAKDAITAGKGGVTPLAVPKGSVSGIAITGPAGDNSWRAATTRGHYVVFMQAAYTDGTDGAATDDRLRKAITDMQLLAIDPIATRTIMGHGPQNQPSAAPSG